MGYQISECALEAFKIWKPLHLHFTSPSYDIFLWKGRVKNASCDNLSSRRDAELFERLAMRLQSKKLIGQTLLANYAVGRNDVVWNWTEECRQHYNTWASRQRTLTHQLSVAVDMFEPSWLEADIQANRLFGLYLSQTIGPEVTCLLDRKLNVIDNWLSTAGTLEPVVLRIAKYRGFVRQESTRINNLLEMLQ